MSDEEKDNVIELAKVLKRESDRQYKENKMLLQLQEYMQDSTNFATIETGICAYNLVRKVGTIRAITLLYLQARKMIHAEISDNEQKSFLTNLDKWVDSVIEDL